MKPLCIDLFCGLGGWAEGFLAEGYDVVGFDNHRHIYGDQKYPGQLVLQDALTLHGKQFSKASVIVASPPCTEYSYMAMPWSRGKQIARALRGQDEFPAEYAGSRTIEELRALFDACFRIAHEASVPLVVENVKGAQPWVGEARAHFGSFYLWGDVNMVGNAIVGPSAKFGETLRARRAQKRNPDGTDHGQGSWFKIANSKERGVKVPNLAQGHFPPGGLAQGAIDGQKVEGYSDPRRNGGKGAHLTSQRENDGRKEMSSLRGFSHPNGGKSDLGGPNDPRRYGSKSDSRKAASAQIAKIPFPLASFIARVFTPAPPHQTR